MALELEAVGVRARIVIPGRAPETPFSDNASERMGLDIPEPYQALAAQMLARFGAGGDVTPPAMSLKPSGAPPRDPSCPMRLPAGADAIARAATAR